MQSACAMFYCYLWPLHLQCFSILSHRRHNFCKKKSHWRQKVFWYSVQFLPQIFILRTIQRDIVKNAHGSLLRLLSDFNDTWSTSTDFRKVLKYEILWKSVQWKPSCCMRTDGRRHDEANRRFSQFCSRAIRTVALGLLPSHPSTEE
jgi:hypothetical protein